jgi:hypothetical protein
MKLVKALNPTMNGRETFYIQCDCNNNYLPPETTSPKNEVFLYCRVCEKLVPEDIIRRGRLANRLGEI